MLVLWRTLSWCSNLIQPIIVALEALHTSCCSYFDIVVWCLYQLVYVWSGLLLVFGFVEELPVI